MENKAFAQQFEIRTRKFAVSIIRLATSLPSTPECAIVRTQITKSATSVGANYREANRARSRADFMSRIKICTAESSETQYWLEIIMEAGWLTWEKIQAEYNECSELLAMFTSIGSKP